MPAMNVLVLPCLFLFLSFSSFASPSSSSSSSKDSNIEKRHTPLVTGCGRGGTHSTAMMLNHLGVNAAHEDYYPNGVSVGWPYGAVVKHNEYIGYEWEPQGRYPFEKVKSYYDRLKHLDTFKPVVLLVRHPLDVISSTRRCFCAKGIRSTKGEILNDGRSWKFVEHNIKLERYLTPDDTDGVQLTWADLGYDDVRRSMVYWLGWNYMVEVERKDKLAGYNGSQVVGTEHVVRLEQPDMLEKLTEKLGLSPSVVSRAKATSMQNGGGGTSNDDYKKQFGMETWVTLYKAAPKLAKKIYIKAKSYGYDTDKPQFLGQYLAQLKAGQMKGDNDNS